MTLTFQTVTLLILQLIRSSLKTELKRFYTTVFRVDEVVNWITDSAFCKARQKIRHRLFIDLYKIPVRFFYAKAGWLRWFHFRLLAVDGSALNLPSSRELLNKYGCHHTNLLEVGRFDRDKNPSGQGEFFDRCTQFHHPGRSN